MNSLLPVAVFGGIGLFNVSAGGHHTCAISSFNGYCWGDNTFGQLGDGTTVASAIPVVVAAVPQILRISAGATQTCGGEVRPGNPSNFPLLCWGDNSFGQLGDGTKNNSSIPVFVFGDTDAVSASTHFSCSNGGSSVICWGDNSVGQLGNGTLVSSTTPVAVTGGFDFLTISSGEQHSCSVTNSFGNPIAYCWGDNSFGQLGDGTTTGRTAPVAVTGGVSFFALSAGGRHSCGISGPFTASAPGSGPAYCWGDNSYGQLGNGTTTNSSVPVLVTGTP